MYCGAFQFLSEANKMLPLPFVAEVSSDVILHSQRVPASTMSQNWVLKVAKSATEDESKILQNGKMVSRNTMKFVDMLVNDAGLLVLTSWHLTSFDTRHLCRSSRLLTRKIKEVTMILIDTKARFVYHTVSFC